MTVLRSGALPDTRDYLALPLSRRIGWVVLLGSMTALGAMNIDLYLPAFPVVQEDFATSATLVQVTLTGALVGFAVGQLVIGPLSDAIGRRVPLLAGLALFLLASLACAFAPTIEVLIALRVLQGVGVAGAAVVALAVVNDLFDGVGAARLVARLILVLGVMPVLAPSIGSYLLELTSWRGLFVLLAVVGAVLAVAASVLLPETLPPARRRPTGVRATARTYRVMLSDRATLGLVLTAGLAISAVFSYIAGAPFVLQEIYGLDAQGFALAFALVGACLVIGTQLTGQLVTSIPAQRLLLIGLTGGMVGSVAVLVLVVTGVGGLAALLVALSVVTVFVGVALPSAASMVLSRHTWAAGSASALLGFTQFGLAGIWAPTFGLFGLRDDLTMGLAMTLAMGAALVLHVALVRTALATPPVLPLHADDQASPAAAPVPA